MSAWLQLTRIALLPTLLWDGIAGAFLSGSWQESSFGFALLCGALIYHGGMVLNDVADASLDREHRPNRPLVRGAISRPLALAVGLLMQFAALCLAWFSFHPEGWKLVAFLVMLVLVYDFGGPLIRKSAGPVLLALARATSLFLPAAAAWGFRESLSSELLCWTAFSYAIYFLFLSRLATLEEQGAAGMRALQYLVAAGMVPFGLVHLSGGLWVGIAWLLWAAMLLPAGFRDRHIFWSPERVQAAVRQSLSLAPWILGMALLLSETPWLAALAPAVSLLVTTLARRFAPE
ncbi:MAG: hypothetical protein DWQ01_13275 [Planctomycetota bacterium]|nr:MAG: hypothetical protein DWQ01_13275 [Planctomycetota bacterium]